MGYMKIFNLYKDQAVLLFKKCYVLEKVHGTSAHIAYDGIDTPTLTFFSGGEKHENFIKLFNHQELLDKFNELFKGYKVTVYGEAYGGKQQGMKDTYGLDLRFIVFDVKIDEAWTDVPNMDDIAGKLGLEVVPWCESSTDVATLDALRDKPSEVALRRGCGPDKVREGIVIRPIIECWSKNGRIIAKHKGEAFSERKTSQKVEDPTRLKVLTEAEDIANEWVTPHRLDHVLQKLPFVYDPDMSDTGKVISAMVEDVYLEAKGEIVESKEVTASIGRMTAKLFKNSLKSRVR